MVWIPRRWFSGWVFYQSPSKFASGILGWFYITSSLTHPRPTNTWLICKNTFKGKTHRYITLYWGNMHAAKTFLFNRIPNSTHNQWISSIFALFHHWSYPTTDSRPSTNQPSGIAGRRPSPSRDFACWFSCPGLKDFNLYGFGSKFLASLELYWFAANMIMIKIVGILADVWAKTINQYTRPGRHTKNYGTSPCYSWEHPLFLWTFPIAFCRFTRGYLH